MGTRIKFFSDPHSDINQWRLDDLFNGCDENYDIALIAGDIAGDQEDIEYFLNTYFPNKRVFFVTGNHDLVYSHDNYLRRLTLNTTKQKLRNVYGPHNELHRVLDNEYAKLSDGLYVIGSTFYTDYALFGRGEIRERQMYLGEQFLNDFRFGHVESEKGGTRLLRARDYLKFHKESKRKIKAIHDKIVEEDRNAKIILVTHHCLSDKCISPEFQTSRGNASFVSNLEKWVVEKLPNVVVVHSGHVHHCDVFEFGPDNHKVKYILNPVGYLQYGEGDSYNKNLIMEL